MHPLKIFYSTMVFPSGIKSHLKATQQFCFWPEDVELARYDPCFLMTFLFPNTDTLRLLGDIQHSSYSTVSHTPHGPS